VQFAAPADIFRGREPPFPKGNPINPRHGIPVLLSIESEKQRFWLQFRTKSCRFLRDQLRVLIHTAWLFFCIFFRIFFWLPGRNSHKGCVYLSVYLGYLAYGVVRGGPGQGRGAGSGSKPRSQKQGYREREPEAGVPGAGASLEAAEGIPTGAPPPGSILMAKGAQGEQWMTHDGGGFPRLHLLMAGGLLEGRGLSPITRPRLSPR